MVDAFGVKSFKLFFDRQAVLDRLEKKEASVLRRTGAVGRREIRKRVRPKPSRKRKKRSKYPYFHGSRDAGLRYVLFVYEPSRGSVVVGPQKFNAKTTYRQKSRTVRVQSRKTVPELINNGGISRSTLTYRSGRSYTTTKRIRPHPFVEDAEPPTRRAFLRNVQQVRF